MSIVKMKKIVLLGSFKDEDIILKTIRNTGLMHFDTCKLKYNKGNFQYKLISKMYIDKLEKSRNILSHYLYINKYINNFNGNLHDILDSILYNHNKKKILLQKLKNINDELDKLKPWGDFDVSEMLFLQKNGIAFKLCIIENQQWYSLNKNKLIFSIINNDSKYTYVVMLVDALDHLPIKNVLVPKHSEAYLLKEQKHILKQIEEINQQIRSFCYVKKDIIKELNRLYNEKEFEFAKAHILKNESFFELSGFVPADKEKEFNSKLCVNDVAIISEEPKKDSKVPVKLKNNIFFNGFEFILYMFSGIKYQEKDVTWVIGLLFIMFGSLCLLDGGYGILLSLTGIILQYRRQVYLGKVFCITGIASTILGLLGGQFFGLIIGKDFLMSMSPIINLASDPLSCFIFSLVVGLCAMGFSYCIAIWQDGIKTSALGGLLFVLTILCCVISNLNCFFSYISYILSYILLSFTILCWFAFPDEVFGNSRIPNIIWTIYSGITGLIQDILSHMRLFGISLSGAILALVINKIAIMFPLYITVIFVVFGHVFVFLLALLSLYIHTNRLIFLEFGSKCIKGGHYLYSPFCWSYFL